MELIVISASQLKIMLTSDDMQKYKLDCIGADLKGEDSKRVFKSILAEAREMCGFDLGEERAFIQLYPSKSGGCEIFVSRAELGTALTNPEGASDSSGRAEAVSKHLQGKEKRLAVRLEGIRDVLSLCRRLASYRDGVSSSSLWVDEYERYHLELVTGKADASVCRELETVLKEYGIPEPQGELALYIGEHGRAVRLGDALSMLSGL